MITLRHAALAAITFAVATQTLDAAPWGAPYGPGGVYPGPRVAGPPGTGSTLQVRLLEEREDAYRVGILVGDPRGWWVRAYPQRGRIVIEATRQNLRVGPHGQAGSTARMRRSFGVPWDALPEQMTVAETNEGWEVSIPRRTSR